MARARRINRPELIYHVFNRGNNRQSIFLEEEDFELYVSLIYRYKKKFLFKIYSFCLMTNHVHLLIQVSEKATISQIMQCITNAHTRHYHFKYQSIGHVWQGRFKSPIISDDEHLLTVMKYIEQNPVRAKMVKRIEEYKWSSYILNGRTKASKLIDRDENPVYLQLGSDNGERSRKYRQFLRDELAEEDLEEIRKSVRYGESYISEQFRGRIKEVLPKKRGRGRPRKEGIMR